MSILTKFRIPTIMGLALIIGGMIGGVYLVLQNQTLQTKASVDATPHNIEVTNEGNSEFSVSWQTVGPAVGFLVINVAGSDQTILDDQDPTTPQPKLLHHVTVKNLAPGTIYQYKIVSGKLKLPPMQATTTVGSHQNGASPIIGQVLSGSQYLKNGLVFLEVAAAKKQSTVIKNYGNFVIPISQMSSVNDATVGKITIIDELLQETTVIFFLKKPLPPIQAGTNIDLTQAPPAAKGDISKFDLNADSQINSSDYSLILQNFGKSPKNQQADLNSDGVVDQKDLDLIQKQMH